MTKKKDKPKGQKLSARDLQRSVFRLFKSQAKKQLNPKQVIKKLKLANNKDSVQHAINQLVDQKKLVALDDYKYQYNRDSENRGGGRSGKTYEGRVDMTRSGAAYILIDGLENDVFISQRNVNTALNGDRVKIRTWTPRGRQKMEGEVMEIIERATEHFVGTLNVYNRFAVVAIDGGNFPFDILIDPEQMQGAKSGEKVVVKIIDWEGGRFGNPLGKITAVLGEPGTSDIEMKAILINNGFQISFPAEVLEEAEALTDKLTPQELHRRRDFRDVTTFTIDPIDARDFDDALSLRHLDNGRLEIGVHIADVTHFVKPGSALDREALDRATSVYLVDRVCPMLPERLSNELCSLRPHEDKFTFSAVFEFDKNFKVVNRWFGKTIIHSDRRFDYGEAQEIIDKKQGDFAEELLLLNKVAKKLRERRFKDGSIDFDAEEVRFRLDEQGRPIEIYVKERLETNMLIEDFMLLANREVAEYISKKEARLKENIPFVFRVHDEPDPDKVAELARFAAELGLQMDISNPKAIARSYNRLMAEAEKDPGLKLLSPLAIRTMAKAEYSTQNIGHYGLGFSDYTHFTSPIRRYADVLVHRILEANLDEGTLYKVNASRLDEECKHISQQERKAANAERESIKYKQVEFIQDHIGESFPGVVSGIAEFGVFVELSDSRCEGMITYDHMDESYDLGSGRLTLKGRQTGKVIRMGDSVQVRILDADLKKRQISMALEAVLTEREAGERSSDEKTAAPAKPSQGRSRRSGGNRRKSSGSSSANNSDGSGGSRRRSGAAATNRAQQNGQSKRTTSTRKRKSE